MGSVLYSGGAMADGRSPQLRLGVSVLVENGRITWIRPTEDEGGRPADCEYVDAGGTTIVPGLVDCHSHLPMPGGSHWIDRGSDPTEVLLAVAEANGELLHRSGVRWARDVGSPRRMDDGRERALSIGIRERWRGRRDRPYVPRPARGSPLGCCPGWRSRSKTLTTFLPPRSGSSTTARTWSSSTWMAPIRRPRPGPPTRWLGSFRPSTPAERR